MATDYPCVPFNPVWAVGKLDLKAIYKRRNGDLMTLPVRRHQQWEAKGYTYVTLADHDSLASVAASLPNAGQYVVGLDGDGRQTPWDAARYLETASVTKKQEDADLAALVAEHGVETVEKIKGIKVPAHLRPVDAKRKPATATA